MSRKAKTTQSPAVDPVSQIGASTLTSVVGAKQHIRTLLSAADDAGKPVALSLAELCKQSGKSEVNVRTMLSDLRSPKYAGKAGVFKTISVKGADGVVRYMVAPAVTVPTAEEEQPQA